MSGDRFVTERLGRLTVERREDMPLDQIQGLLAEPGTVLKTSRKSRTRLVRGHVIKEGLLDRGLGPLKRTFLRSNYRRAWFAAKHLRSRGVSVPRPDAFIEFSVAGLVWTSTLVMEYLEGQVTVEEYARRMVAVQATRGEVGSYLERLAAAVSSLCEAGACHGDLSGKNILTGDGERFTFIDLDAMSLGQPYTSRQRMKNHVQLYDSFCDLWDETLLEPFIATLCPPRADRQVWLARVRAGQARRRSRIEARLRRQGKTRESR